MRPSQSRVMKRKVGSTSSLTTRRFKPIALADRPPVVHAGAAQGIDARCCNPALRMASMSMHVRQIADIGVQKIMAMGRRGAQRRFHRHPPDLLQAGLQVLVRALLDPAGHLALGGSAVGRVVLEAAVGGRIVRGRNDDAVRQTWVLPRLYVRMACESTGVGVYSSSFASITSTPFAARTSSALAQAGTESACVSMPRNKGPPIPLLRAVLADRLADRQDVRFVERPVEGRAAMTGGAKSHRLRRHFRIRAPWCSTLSRAAAHPLAGAWSPAYLPED